LTPGGPTWALRIDAQSRKAEGTGAIVSELEREAAGLRFIAQEKTSPMLAPPAGGKIHAPAAAMRDSLAVLNLSPGEYLLTIDGEPVAAASHDHWAKGIAIDASPLHRSAEALRQAVNDKNQQFTYSWRALNQVHIVGERKSSPSGQALPAELIEFKNLADQKDKALRTGVAPQTREWRLTRTGPPITPP